MPFSAKEDVLIAVRRHLVSLTSVCAAVGASGADPWVFVRRLQVVVEGTSSVAVVLNLAGAWSSPNRHNSAQFPRILVEVFADPSRNSVKDIISDDADSRALKAWQSIDNELHRTDAFSEHWGAVSGDPGTRVWGSHLLGHPDTDPVSEWDGGARLSAFYGLSIG